MFDVVLVVGLNTRVKASGDERTVLRQGLRGKAALPEEPRQDVRDLIEEVLLDFFPVIPFPEVTLWHREHDPVGDKVAESPHLLRDGIHIREGVVFHVVVVDVAYDVAVELLLGPDQRLDPSAEGEGKVWVLCRHVLVELPDPLGLGGQEVVVLEHVGHAKEKRSVARIDGIAGPFGILLQVGCIFMQDVEERIAVIEIIRQLNHDIFFAGKQSFPGTV